ncbi:MAG TPA: ABC transporter permease [Candidatus Dormibacteraeota bacterium]|nr:ABC transporter permease [Candidatus Dormibacteraeota bacterium]
MSGQLVLAIAISVAASTLALATPLVFAAIAGTITERSGVLNIALEGMLLAGAFGYVLGTLATHHALLGIVGAAIGALVLALALVLLCVRMPVDQVIMGMAVNIAAAGGTAFLNRSLFGLGGNLTVAGIGNLHLPVLSDLPVVGPALFRESPLTYLALLMVLLAWLFLRFTRAGLWLRAIGESPKAADAAGISVLKIRALAVLSSGCLCGLGGAYLASQVQTFSDNMTAGAGFIALAAVILGRWEPPGALLACLVFALFQSLQTALQVAGAKAPYQFLLMIPYVLTIVVLAGFVGRTVAPAADGKPYRRQ